MNERNIIEFINEKPSSDELYDFKFSEESRSILYR